LLKKARLYIMPGFTGQSFPMYSDPSRMGITIKNSAEQVAMRAAGRAAGAKIEPGVRVGYYRQDFSILDYNQRAYDGLWDAMEEKEILAEKVRAVYQREKARDVYDIWYLLNVKKIQIDFMLIQKNYHILIWNSTKILFSKKYMREKTTGRLIYL